MTAEFEGQIAFNAMKWEVNVAMITRESSVSSFPYSQTKNKTCKQRGKVPRIKAF